MVGERLDELERRLHGVYNLGGKLIALEGMAAEMGCEIPDLEYSPGEGGQAWSHASGGYVPSGPMRTPALQVEGHHGGLERDQNTRSVSPRFGTGGEGRGFAGGGGER